MSRLDIDNKFDFEAFQKDAIEKVMNGQPVTGKNAVLTPLIKKFFETALEAELDTHLSNEVKANRRNGKSRKNIKSESGSFELETSRDRNGSFEPQIIKKRQTTVGDAIEEKILALYGLGTSYNDIRSHLEDVYGLEVSAGTLSSITDKIIPQIKDWQSRHLESIYPFV